MKERNCKECIWYDMCPESAKNEPCDDYFKDDEDNLRIHLSEERIKYYKEWNAYISDAD